MSGRRFWAGIASGMASEDAARCGRRAAGYRNKMVPKGGRHATSDIWSIGEAALWAISVPCRTAQELAGFYNMRGVPDTRDRPADGALGIDDLAELRHAMPRRAAEAWTIVQPQRSGMPTGRLRRPKPVKLAVNLALRAYV